MVVRLTRSSDAPAVWRMLWDAREAIPITSDTGGSVVPPSIRDLCATRQGWVSEADGQVVAALMRWAAGVRYLVVADGHRGEGHSQALMRRAKRWAASARMESLEAKAKSTNAPILAVLRREGFIPDPWAVNDCWDHFVWETRRVP